MPRARKLNEEKKERGVYEKFPGSGEWWVRWTDGEGKLRRQKVGRKSAAITAYRKHKEDARAGVIVPELRNTKRVTVADLTQLAIDATRDHKDARNYVSKAKIVNDALGDRAASDITPQVLEAWLDEHCSTPATRNRYKAFLSLCYRQGMRNGKVTVNVARMVAQKRENNARLRFLTRAEYDKLCAVIQKRCPEHLREFIVSVNTGMRLSEQYTVTWSQVDLDARTIRLEDTKNGSARTVVLNADAVAAIQSIRPSKPNPSAVVFPSDTADYTTKTWFVPCLEDAKIENYVWHSNRHTFCSWLAMAGASIKEIQELAGHKTITMSARYAHLSPDHKLSVIERISAAAKPQAKRKH